jgi:hypothetical protein
VFGSFVQQTDDPGIELVNRLAMFGNVHSQGRMQKAEGRSKSVSP